MTQAEFEREVCDSTGESLATIRRRGFSLVEMPERGPRTVDWDALQQIEPPRFRAPRRRERHAA